MSEKRDVAISANETAAIERSHIRHYGVFIAFVVVTNAAVAWGQPNGATPADASLHAETIATVNDISVECSGVVRSEYQHKETFNELPPSSNGVLVVEDMRCRQCRGKCKAEDLRCRSQCVGENPCLIQCEERASKCETMCKQFFRCE